MMKLTHAQKIPPSQLLYSIQKQCLQTCANKHCQVCSIQEQHQLESRYFTLVNHCEDPFSKPHVSPPVSLWADQSWLICALKNQNCVCTSVVAIPHLMEHRCFIFVFIFAFVIVTCNFHIHLSFWLVCAKQGEQELRLNPNPKPDVYISISRVQMLQLHLELFHVSNFENKSHLPTALNRYSWTEDRARPTILSKNCAQACGGRKLQLSYI